jgi:WD40-like Beta Propeller Repeat
MITQDDLARTAERLRDALTAAADVMAESDAAEAVTPVPPRPGRLRRARAWLVPLAAAACVVAVIAASVLLARNLARTSPPASQPAYPGLSVCAPLPAAGPGPALPRFYVTTDVAARQIQLQVRRTSDCTVTAVVSLPAGWLLTGGISATADGRAFFAAAFRASRCPVQAGAGGISSAAHETRFFRFAVNDQGRAGRLTVVGPPVAGLVGSIAVSPDGSRIAFNASGANFAGPGTACTGGEAEGGAVVRVIDLATGKIRTWQSDTMRPAPAGTGVTPGAVSWMADGRTLAVSYVWPPNPSGPQLSLAVVALDTTSGGGSLQAHSRLLWSQPNKYAFSVQEALISPDGKNLTAAANLQTAHGYRNVLLRIALPSGRYRILYESPPQTYSISAITQDGTGQHVIVVSGSQAGWIRAGKLVLLGAPGSALQLSDGIDTIAW